MLGIWTCFSCHRGHKGCQWISSHGCDSSQSSPSRLRGKESGLVVIIPLGVLVTCFSHSEMLSVCFPSALSTHHILSLFSFSFSNAGLSCFHLKPWFYLTFLIHLLSVPFLMKCYCWPQACYSPDFFGCSSVIFYSPVLHFFHCLLLETNTFWLLSPFEWCQPLCDLNYDLVILIIYLHSYFEPNTHYLVLMTSYKFMVSTL